MISERAQNPQHSRLTTPAAITVFASAVLIGFASLAGLMVWQNYRATVETAEARALSSAHVVAAHVEWIMEASDQALQRIDATLGSAPVSSVDGAISDIRKAVGNLPEGFQYSVYDETGRLAYSSVPEAVGIQVSDREYFQRLRDGEPIVISPQLEERLSGEQVFVIARRISRGNQFHGAASIAVPTKLMFEFWDSLELGPRSTVSVFRSDAWLMARFPQIPETTSLSSTPLFTEYLPQAPSGTYHSAVSPVDGMARIVGYRQIDQWPIIATTGIERGEALKAFYANLIDGLVIGVPLVALLVGGILFILRLLRADLERRTSLEHALQRNKVLMREIHHRVKNNLQAVSSLVRLQPLPEERKDDLARRIAAMVAVHEQIYGSDQFEQVEVGPYVEQLVKDVAQGFPTKVIIDTRIERLTVGPDEAMPLGLIVNEVVTNTFKHAFAKGTGERLTVSLSAVGDNIVLVFTDDGPGYDPGLKNGMGSRLIKGFVAQLGGALEIDGSAGTKTVITFPLHRGHQ